MGKRAPKKGPSKEGGKRAGGGSATWIIAMVVALTACLAAAWVTGGAAAAATGTPSSTGEAMPEKRVYSAEEKAAWTKISIDELDQLPPVERDFAKMDDDVWNRARAGLSAHPNATLLFTNPDVWIVKDLVTAEEADELAAFSRKRYEQRDADPRWCFAKAAFDLGKAIPGVATFTDGAGDACTTDQAAGRSLAEQHDRYVSRSTMVSKAESGAFDAIGARVQAAVGLDEAHAFHHQVLEYERAEEYSVHTDCNNAENDRVGTELLYLTDVEEGGEVCFPRRKACVRPRKGSAVFFASTDKRGRCDKTSEHIAMPVRTGKKIVLQRWFYRNWLIPTGESDSILCDIGNNCRHYMYDQRRVEAVRRGEAGTKAKKAGDTGTAAREYAAAVKAYPTYPYTAAWHGEVLFNANRKEESLEHFQNAIRAAPLFPDAHYFAGTALLEASRFSESVHHFTKLITAQPKDKDGHFMLADALMQQARADGPGPGGRKLKQQARAALEKHMRLNPGDRQAQEMLQQLT